jgi:signal transduction histidine kinase
VSIATVDARRAAAIAQYDVIDRPPRNELRAVVELTAQVCQTPMATINLITDVAQHQVATVGFDASVCRREDSMCAAVLDADTPLVVTDASLDSRFRDNPFVTGQIGNVRFYASHHLKTREGVTIGTLCVFDEEPRTLDREQVTALSTLADRIVDILELSLRSRQLADSNERLATFAGRLSHDLKTPLTSISLTLQLIQEQLGAGGAPDAEWLVDKALSGADRMAVMIDHLLDYASVGGSLTRTDVDLGAVLADVLTDLGARLDGAAVTVGALPTVDGDEVQLRTVLQNLLDNAVKYRHPDRPPVIDVAAHRRGAAWRIEVTDNGRGVPEQDRHRVFEPRARADDSEPGSGIGLDTCRRVVEAHGGGMGLEPAAGGGTTVWFDLPA